MSRTRLIRPAFFKHGELYDAEQESGLPIRIAFAGLWTVADRPDGRFAWKPRDLKADILPHDALDFADVLDALHQHGFVIRYVVDGKHYGAIPSFGIHQTFHKKEVDSKLPGPTDPDATPVEPRLSREDAVTVAGTVAVADTGTNCSAPLAPEREELWNAIREHLYTPDGSCPTGWSEERDGSILKQLRAKYKAGDILAAIEGLALLRDFPGKYGDVIDWLQPGEKVTLKALYNTRSGVRNVMGQAIDAAHRRHNLSAEREATAARQPTRITALVPKTA